MDGPIDRQTGRAGLLVAALVLGLVASAHAGESPGGRDDLTPIGPEDWGYEAAAHLLDRAGFGGTPAEIERLSRLEPADAVRRLVRYQEIPGVELPVFDASGIFPSEEFVPPTGSDQRRYFVEAFVRKKTLGIETERRRGSGWAQPVLDQIFYLRFANGAEITRVARWQAERALLSSRPLEEKLALFWHGHFATENDKVRDYRKTMAQWELFRTHGNRKFRDLLLGICRDPAMLIYLDSASNVRGHPNENFARELLELFTLGVGHYTEQDVKEAARAFTGWGLDGNEFDKSWWDHDRGPKSFLGREGRLDGEDVIDAILAHEASARFVAAKLYRYFVRSDPSPELLDELASLFRESGHDVGVLLETLFLSRDFYSAASRGIRVKGPVELVISTYRKLGLTEVPGTPNFNLVTRSLGQQLYDPPNVAGWPGGRSWITPSTLVTRQNFARYVLFPGEVPAPRRRLMDFVADVIGTEAYEQMNAMARRGDFTGTPVMPASVDASGFARTPGLQNQAADAFRGVYNGARKALSSIRFDDPVPARFELAAMLRRQGVDDARGAVDYLARRFLSVSLGAADRAALVAYLEDRNGGARMDPGRAGLERDLRELLHLIMSLPEYQLT